MSWKERGNCNGEPPQIFYRKDPRKAKSVCADCPVQEECAIYAIRNHEYGIWGGYTEGERDLLYRQSIVQAVPLIELLRRNRRELTRLANVFPSHPFYKPGLRNRSREAFGKAAALLPLTFGKVCTVS